MGRGAGSNQDSRERKNRRQANLPGPTFPIRVRTTRTIADPWRTVGDGERDRKGEAAGETAIFSTGGSMDEIISQHVKDLIAERDALKAENETLRHSFIFENSVSKVIHERLKLAYDLVVASNRKLSDAIDVQANRIAELSRQLADMRKRSGGEE
jgi:hypothetical protein